MSSFVVTWDFDQLGDYEGISARHGQVMPIWADNRNEVGPVTIWTAIVNETVMANCQQFTVSYSVSPTQCVLNQPCQFTAIVTGGSGSYSYEWNFSESSKIDCSLAQCSYTYTLSSIGQAALLVTDNKSGCYRGATAFIEPVNADHY